MAHWDTAPVQTARHAPLRGRLLRHRRDHRRNVERFATKGDRTFIHIFDPKTGYPVEGDLLSVTVITEDPVAGDALSTAFMVMGIDRTLAFLEKRHGVEAVFVSRAGDAKLDVLATGGLRGFLHSMEEGVEISFTEATR